MTLKKTLTLEDILPLKPDFTLNKNSYSLRLPNLDDQVWIKNTFGSPEALMKMINELDWANLCRFVYHQFSQEDRAKFPATRAKIINDDGESMEVLLTGPEMLLKELGGIQDALPMVQAVTTAIVRSNPLLEEAFMGEVKKNPEMMRLLTGPKSSTKSKANMVGQKTK